MNAAWIAGLLAVTMLVSFVLTFLVRALAPRIGLTDRPDGCRKLHRRATPLGGGVAVFLTTAAAMLALLFVVPNPWQDNLQHCVRWQLGMLGAAGAIVLLGLLDDRFCLRGRHKLLGQLAIALCLALNGNSVRIHSFVVFGGEFDLGWLTVPFTTLWLLGAINAVNLLDGIDGLATVLGAILAGTFAVIACMIGRPEIAVVALALTGSLLGFAWFNFPPATIFLGDAGSMLIGLMLGILAIEGSLKGPGTVLLAAPLAALTLPILDSLAAILRRKLTGRSIYTADRGHLHHRLMDRLGSNVKVLCFAAGCCVLTSAGAMVSVFLKNDLLAVLAGLGVVAVLVASGMFGRAEFLLLVGRGRSFARSFLKLADPTGDGTATESAVRLQGSIEWRNIWNALTESAEKLMLRRMHLDVNMPLLHEGFHAVWRKPSADDDAHCWHLEMPLMVDSQQVGQLKVVGQPRQGTAQEEMALLLELVGTCESYLQSVMHTQTVLRRNGRAHAKHRGRGVRDFLGVK